MANGRYGSTATDYQCTRHVRSSLKSGHFGTAHQVTIGPKPASGVTSAAAIRHRYLPWLRSLFLQYAKRTQPRPKSLQRCARRHPALLLLRQPLVDLIRRHQVHAAETW
jgi:hypothetical protein